jgi:hypothetical protein
MRVSMDNDLIEAYENADYAIFVEPPLILKVGEHSSRLDELMQAEGTGTAAYVTAANPHSVRRSAAENNAANEALENLIGASGYPWRAGEGRDPDGRWPAERGFLIFGIYKNNAELLGRLFKQNAIVFIELEKAPELVLLES